MNKIIAAALMVLVMASGPAVADRIDGNWCSRDGRNMTIDGPKIRTPGGMVMTGEYDRHGFRYVVPEGEPGAGVTVTMVQLDDQTINVHAGKDPAVHVWNRCSLQISRGDGAEAQPFQARPQGRPGPMAWLAAAS